MLHARGSGGYLGAGMGGRGLVGGGPGHGGNLTEVGMTWLEDIWLAIQNAKNGYATLKRTLARMARRCCVVPIVRRDDIGKRDRVYTIPLVYGSTSVRGQHGLT